MKIGFIGLGIMGSRMASHLVRNGAEVMVYNRSTEAAEPLMALGATVAESAVSLAAKVDVVFSMLSTTEAVEAVFFGDQGALAAMHAETIWIDCSTVNPSFSRVCATAAEQHGVHFVDAPVAGSKPQAEAAELVFFAGGAAAQLDRVTPYMEMMGKKVVRFDETGHGASFKLLVNMLLGQSMLVFSETVIFGEQMGLDRSFLLNALSALPVSAPFTQMKAKTIAEDDYEVQFPLEWMYKDLRLASETAQELGHSLRINTAAAAHYKEALAADMNRLDFSAIHKFLSESA